MSKFRSNRATAIFQTAKKIVVSAIVVGAFAVYMIRDRFLNTGDSRAGPAMTPTSTDLRSAAGLPSAWPTYPEPSDATQTEAPTPTVLPLAAPAGGYKDGTYTGPVTDAYFGNVQVQIIVSGGKISQVNFLQYPRHRRTSEIINMRAMPRLENEVIQSQNVNVNSITGATLTSEAFEQSLKVALSSAQH